MSQKLGLKIELVYNIVTAAEYHSHSALLTPLFMTMYGFINVTDRNNTIYFGDVTIGTKE